MPAVPFSKGNFERAKTPFQTKHQKRPRQRQVQRVQRLQQLHVPASRWTGRHYSTSDNIGYRTENDYMLLLKTSTCRTGERVIRRRLQVNDIRTVEGREHGRKETLDQRHRESNGSYCELELGRMSMVRP